MKNVSQNVMVSMAISANQVEKLIAAGLAHIFRTRAEQEARTKMYEQTAPKKDVYRLNRVDGTGNLQADGGNLLFGQNGTGNICPSKTQQDLVNNGYILVVAEVFEKEGAGGRGFLRLVYAKNGVEVRLSDDLEVKISVITGHTYKYCHGYFNAEAQTMPSKNSPISGSISTLNLTWPIYNGKEVKQVKVAGEQKFLRVIDVNGHVRCQ